MPPPADGGIAAAAAFEAMRTGASPEAALARGLAVVQTLRSQGGDPAVVLAAAGLPEARPPPCRPRPGWWCSTVRGGGDLRLHPQQPVRHWPDGAGHGLPAGGGAWARHGAATAALGCHRL
ncbi:hypothetical protein ACFQU2_20375 [Siccirubricoccus deserti]